MEANEKGVSRRDALRRMAKVTMGIGMGLQLVGSFVPSGHAAVTAAQGARFSTIGQVSSPAIGVATAGAVNSVTREGCYTNGAGYSNNGYQPYSKYVNCNP
ncbi:MAG TPA: hypothetical protein PKI19_00245 [Elusimicrobiales bacterium]|nr:hypothetical protein [Elusimicrobiales bacterium]